VSSQLAALFIEKGFESIKPPFELSSVTRPETWLFTFPVLARVVIPTTPSAGGLLSVALDL
jgi:hypothetical protein